MQHPHTKISRRSGQAMIELMLGLILILLLLVGSTEFMTVANKHNDLTSVIRSQAGLRALAPVLIEDTPPYIVNWQPGTDGQRYTADDVSTLGSPVTISRVASYSVANASDWNAVGTLAQPSSLEQLQQDPPPLAALGFVNSSMSVSLPVSAIAQDLFYNQPEILVQEQIWLPNVNELY